MPVIVGIIAIFGALIILVCVLLMNGAFDKEEGEVAGEAPIEQQSVQEEEAPVAYTTYTTDDLVTRDYSYPVFQFEFPSTWSIIKESSNAFQEKVEMQRSGSNAIAYKLLDPDQPVNLDSGISNIEKVSDCDLRARLADESGDGYHYEQYVVAKMDVASANDTTKSVYAVIPEDGVSDRSKMNLIGTAPAFDLGCWVSFSFEAKEDMDQGILDEAIEVLSSLQMLGIEDMEASGYGYYDSSDPGYCSSGQGYYSPYSDGSYLIPESGTRLLTDRDLDGYDAYYLYFARNEIFARHGRKFQNDDLQEYFNLMPWYTPLIEPEDFDDSYLSDIEKANYEKILEYERAMDSPYI
ncbi:MAG: YARHG domain-containing protein [Eggerthellaceae bacterium]|nr:YARHG domain-containing protein [Eggerthellaceae bacterium]